VWGWGAAADPAECIGTTARAYVRVGGGIPRLVSGYIRSRSRIGQRVEVSAPHARLTEKLRVRPTPLNEFPFQRLIDMKGSAPISIVRLAQLLIGKPLLGEGSAGWCAAQRGPPAAVLLNCRPGPQTMFEIEAHRCHREQIRGCTGRVRRDSFSGRRHNKPPA